MKKTFVKLIAGAFIVATIGASTATVGTSAMMPNNDDAHAQAMIKLQALPEVDQRGNQLTYTVSRNGVIARTTWVDGIPNRPEIIFNPGINF